jgi:hypothetical protein
MNVFSRNFFKNSDGNQIMDAYINDNDKDFLKQ